MISYLDDFKLMMIITICAMPLAWFLRKPTPRVLPPGQAPIAHD
jgi:DHA2 family multidrug resistance protein